MEPPRQPHPEIGSEPPAPRGIGLPKWGKVAKVAKVANFLGITPVAPLLSRRERSAVR